MTNNELKIQILERIEANTFAYLDEHMDKAAKGEAALSSSLLREVVNLIKANREAMAAHKATELHYHHTLELLENLPDDFPA